MANQGREAMTNARVLVNEARELLRTPLEIAEWAKRARTLLTNIASKDDPDEEDAFCWVCRSRHRLVVSECRAMDGIL